MARLINRQYQPIKNLQYESCASWRTSFAAVSLLRKEQTVNLWRKEQTVNLWRKE